MVYAREVVEEIHEEDVTGRFILEELIEGLPAYGLKGQRWNRAADVVESAVARNHLFIAIAALRQASAHAALAMEELPFDREES